MCYEPAWFLVFYICVALEASAFVEKAGAFCFAHAPEETVNRGLRPCNGGNVFIDTGAICPKKTKGMNGLKGSLEKTDLRLRT